MLMTANPASSSSARRDVVVCAGAPQLATSSRLSALARGVGVGRVVGAASAAAVVNPARESMLVMRGSGLFAVAMAAAQPLTHEQCAILGALIDPDARVADRTLGALVRRLGIGKRELATQLEEP